MTLTLPPALMARLSAYAVRVGLGRQAAAVALLTSALDADEARRAGAALTNAAPPAERSARARTAALRRWARVRGEDV